MSRLMSFFLLQLFVISVFGQAVGKAQSGRITSKPTAVVQSLYRQVIARHPLGLPSGKNWEVFAPFLSGGLLRKISLARSCQNDWVQQNQGKMVKEPFAWAETGLFSGDEELSEPSSFRIERTESNRDGSSRVYVQLTESVPNEKSWSWNVAIQMKLEEKGPVIDDVVYIKGGVVHAEYRLSELLTEGCDGSQWVGENKQRQDPVP